MPTITERWPLYDPACNELTIPFTGEAVIDCSSPGDCSDACEHWCSELNVDCPPWLLRRYLRQYGAWDAQELADHDQNLLRLIWIAAADVRQEAQENGMPEDPDADATTYVYLGA